MLRDRPEWDTEPVVGMGPEAVRVHRSGHMGREPMNLGDQGLGALYVFNKGRGRFL